MRLSLRGSVGIGVKGQRQRGFTLIEMITTVAILGIVTSIAWSYYKNQKLHSYRSQAVIALTTLAQLQESYMSDNGSYASSIAQLSPPTSVLTATNTTPKGFYQLTINNPATANCQANVNGVVRYYCYTFTATAISAQANDTACATLTLDQTGKRGSAGGGTDCWAK